MAQTSIPELEKQIFELTTQLNELRADNPRQEVRNYSFASLDGEVSLLDLFAGKDKLLAVQNQQAERNCPNDAVCDHLKRRDGRSPFEIGWQYAPHKIRNQGGNDSVARIGRMCGRSIQVFSRRSGLCTAGFNHSSWYKTSCFFGAADR